ncbi:ABC transporter permease [Massilia sp. B-10]|nr:ABC transporter permease [Massilia sp. B-10]
MAVSAALALLQGFVSITQKGNQLVGGIAINIAMSGLTFVLAQFFYQQGGRTPDLGDARLFDIVLPGTAAVADIPFLGWFYGHVIGGHSALVYLAFALIPIVHWVIYHSRFGLRLRACGENPHAADAARRERRNHALHGDAGGRPAVLVLGCLPGDRPERLLPARYVGRCLSYLALTALVFGNWRPMYTALGCIMFGFFNAVQVQIEGVELPGVGRIPGSLIQMIPYVVTVIVLAKPDGQVGGAEIDRQAVRQVALIQGWGQAPPCFYSLPSISEMRCPRRCRTASMNCADKGDQFQNSNASTTKLASGCTQCGSALGWPQC